MPGMTIPSILDEVHRSCKTVVEASGSVSLNATAIQQFGQQLDAAAVQAAGAKASTVFPIKFDSLEAEVTFIALCHLLDFGSGYDQLLQASCKRSAQETMQYGCFGLALSAKRLDAPWMAAFSAYHVHSTFGIEAKVEEQLQPGISISKPGPLAPLAAAVQSVVVEAGKALQAAGQKSLGALVLEHLDGLKAAGRPSTAASLIEELAETIPGFQDSGLFVLPLASSAAVPSAATEEGGAASDPAAAAVPSATSAGTASDGSVRVVFVRKAQALAADLAARFRQEDQRFDWQDAASISGDSGAVLIAVLRHLGLINCSAGLAAVLEQQQPLQLDADERALRAAAVTALDAAVEAAAAAENSSSSRSGAGFTASDLSNFLLSEVKESGQQLLFRGAVLKPHINFSTIAY